MRKVGLLLLVGVAGCGAPKNELFPVSEHSNWTYLVNNVNAFTDNVSYSRPIAVGDVKGFELVSDMGVSHFAWKNGNLISNEMAGSRVSPPIPILTAVMDKPVAWSGSVDSGEKIEQATATTTTNKAKLDLHGSLIDTTQSVIKVTLPGREIDIVNWFKSGTGLVRQEQRTNDRLDVTLEYLKSSDKK